MPSSFDQTESLVVTEEVQDVFKGVTALFAYYVLLNPQVRSRAKYRCGEIDAEPVDFLCDVSIKAKRCLTPVEFALWERLGCTEDSATLLSPEIKAKLRLAWANLVPGYYLLFKSAQKNWDRDQRKLRKAQAEAEQLLTTQDETDYAQTDQEEPNAA